MRDRTDQVEVDAVDDCDIVELDADDCVDRDEDVGAGEVSVSRDDGAGYAFDDGLDEDARDVSCPPEDEVPTDRPAAYAPPSPCDVDGDDDGCDDRTAALGRVDADRPDDTTGPDCPPDAGRTADDCPPDAGPTSDDGGTGGDGRTGGAVLTAGGSPPDGSGPLVPLPAVPDATGAQQVAAVPVEAGVVPGGLNANPALAAIDADGVQAQINALQSVPVPGGTTTDLNALVVLSTLGAAQRAADDTLLGFAGLPGSSAAGQTAAMIHNAFTATPGQRRTMDALNNGFVAEQGVRNDVAENEINRSANRQQHEENLLEIRAANGAL